MERRVRQSETAGEVGQEPLDHDGTFRLISPTDTKAKALQRYLGYFHWANALSYTVFKHGTRGTKDGTQVFYHGINQRMLFDDACAYFYAPTSTTIDPVIAQHFSTEHGIIICIDARSNKRFDCSWLSDFEYEKEVLFLDGYAGNLGGAGSVCGWANDSKLRIVGLFDCRLGLKFDAFFRGLSLLTDWLFPTKTAFAMLIGSHYRSVSYHERTANVDTRVPWALRLMFDHRLGINIDNAESRHYIHDVFERYCLKKDTLVIDQDVMNYLRQNVPAMQTQSPLDISVLMRLFPNIKHVCIKIECHLEDHEKYILKIIDSFLHIQSIALGKFKAKRWQFIFDEATNQNIRIPKFCRDYLPKRLWSFDISYAAKPPKAKTSEVLASGIFRSEISLLSFESARVTKAVVVPHDFGLTRYEIHVRRGRRTHVVRRRYSEFLRLQKCLLSKGFVGGCPFPPKRIIWDEQLIAERVCGLNAWMQDAIANIARTGTRTNQQRMLKDLSIFLKSYSMNVDD